MGHPRGGRNSQKRGREYRRQAGRPNLALLTLRAVTRPLRGRACHGRDSQEHSPARVPRRDPGDRPAEQGSLAEKGRGSLALSSELWSRSSRHRAGPPARRLQSSLCGTREQEVSLFVGAPSAARLLWARPSQHAWAAGPAAGLPGVLAPAPGRRQNPDRGLVWWVSERAPGCRPQRTPPPQGCQVRCRKRPLPRKARGLPEAESKLGRQERAYLIRSPRINFLGIPPCSLMQIRARRFLQGPGGRAAGISRCLTSVSPAKHIYTSRTF